MVALIRYIAIFVISWRLISASELPHIAIVLSADATPYQQTADAIVRHLDGIATHQTTQLTSLTSEILTKARGVIAIGTTAATTLRVSLQPQQFLVYALVADPVSAGLTDDPRIFGVSASVPLQQQFALIQQALPTCTRIGILHRNDLNVIAAAQAAAPANWTIVPIAVDQVARIAEPINQVTRDADIIWTYPDGGLFTDASVRMLLLTALRRRVPVFGFSSAFVRAGALMGVGVEPDAIGDQCGILVADLLAGKPITTPHQAPTFHTIVNPIVANKLILTLPPTFLATCTVLESGNR